jgi:hypothetical protein
MLGISNSEGYTQTNTNVLLADGCGSYRCMCGVGFKMSNDYRFCQPVDPNYRPPQVQQPPRVAVEVPVVQRPVSAPAPVRSPPISVVEVPGRPISVQQPIPVQQRPPRVVEMPAAVPPMNFAYYSDYDYYTYNEGYEYYEDPMEQVVDFLVTKELMTKKDCPSPCDMHECGPQGQCVPDQEDRRQSPDVVLKMLILKRLKARGKEGCPAVGYSCVCPNAVPSTTPEGFPSCSNGMTQGGSIGR